MSLRG